jgi:hypothetical protein
MAEAEAKALRANDPALASNQLPTIREKFQILIQSTISQYIQSGDLKSYALSGICNWRNFPQYDIP